MGEMEGSAMCVLGSDAEFTFSACNDLLSVSVLRVFACGVML